jgi:hypothetical protein
LGLDERGDGIALALTKNNVYFFYIVTQEPRQSATEEELEEKSKIFTGTSKPLTNYQQAINKKALELSKQDYSLLLNRGKLFEESRKKVKEDGYYFVKGKSRAKDNDESEKRVKTSKDDRAEYIKLLNQDILAKEEQIRYKEQRVGMAKNSKNWELCDKLTGEISKLRKETFELKQEFKLIQRKQSQSFWYDKSKSKKKNIKGKKADKEAQIGGNDEVLIVDAKDKSSSSVTLPSLFNRLKEKEAASVLEISTTKEASANSVEECITKRSLTEPVNNEITSAKESIIVQPLENEDTEGTNVHFL